MCIFVMGQPRFSFILLFVKHNSSVAYGGRGVQLRFAFVILRYLLFVVRVLILHNLSFVFLVCHLQFSVRHHMLYTRFSFAALHHFSFAFCVRHLLFPSFLFAVTCATHLPFSVHHFSFSLHRFWFANMCYAFLINSSPFSVHHHL